MEHGPFAIFFSFLQISDKLRTVPFFNDCGKTCSLRKKLLQQLT